jgi:hypothetical protein
MYNSIDYNLSKIYFVYSPSYDKIYIGSTSQICLDAYLKSYLSKYKRYTEGKQNFVSIFLLLKFNDCKIFLIEDYPCKSSVELMKREGEIILLNKDICVNQNIVGRTHIESVKAYNLKCKLDYRHSEYKTTIKERLKNQKFQNKIDRFIDVETQQKRDITNAKRLKWINEYNRKNRDEVNRKQCARSKQKFTCVCGVLLSKGSKYSHVVGHSHLKYIEDEKKKIFINPCNKIVNYKEMLETFNLK